MMMMMMMTLKLRKDLARVLCNDGEDDSYDTGYMYTIVYCNAVEGTSCSYHAQG